jgi:hypothetical protein
MMMLEENKLEHLFFVGSLRMVYLLIYVSRRVEHSSMCSILLTLWVNKLEHLFFTGRLGMIDYFR